MKIYLLCFFILVPHIMFSQETKIERQKQDTTIKPKNAVFLQLVGESLFITINYERIFLKQKIGVLSGRVGIGLPFWALESFPVTVQETIGKKHCAEIGAGGVFYTVFTPFDLNGYQLRKLFFIGYRFQSRNFIFRANVAITYNSVINLFDYLPGISIGVRF